MTKQNEIVGWNDYTRSYGGREIRTINPTIQSGSTVLFDLTAQDPRHGTPVRALLRACFAGDDPSRIALRVASAPAGHANRDRRCMSPALWTVDGLSRCVSRLCIFVR